MIIFFCLYCCHMTNKVAYKAENIGSVYDTACCIPAKLSPGRHVHVIGFHNFWPSAAKHARSLMEFVRVFLAFKATTLMLVVHSGWYIPTFRSRLKLICFTITNPPPVFLVLFGDWTAFTDLGLGSNLAGSGVCWFSFFSFCIFFVSQFLVSVTYWTRRPRSES